MFAVEFETHIENGIVHVPAKYSKLQSIDAKVINLAKEPEEAKVFDPKEFFGSANVLKKDIDTYLAASKDEWE